MKYQSILVICTGNICRSPTGEYILKQRLPNIKIESAGTSAEKGERAFPNTIKIANNHNLDLRNHIARQLTFDMIEEFDLILAAEEKHIQQAININSAAKNKTFLFTHWLDNKPVIDPWYYQEDKIFEEVFIHLENAANAFIQKNLEENP